MENCMINPPDEYHDWRDDADDDQPDVLNCLACGALCFDLFCHPCVDKEEEIFHGRA